MKPEDPQTRFSGKQIVSYYLGVALFLASFATVSPWVHQVFEHQSFDREQAHVHTAGHPHPHEASPGRGHDKDNSSTSHEHHGLSGLIASGLLDVADGFVVLSLPSDQAVDIRFFIPDARYRRAFDFIQAQRPPPALG